MNAQTLLDEIERLETEIQRLALRRDSLRAIAESTVTVLRIDNVTGSHNNRKLEDLLNESAELDKKIAVLHDELVDRKLEFVNYLEAKGCTDAQIIFLRLFERKTWNQIAQTVGYCEKSCRLKYAKAIRTYQIGK